MMSLSILTKTDKIKKNPYNMQMLLYALPEIHTSTVEKNKLMEKWN